MTGRRPQQMGTRRKKVMPPGKPFEKGSERTRAAGRKGGAAKSRLTYRGPYKGSVLDLLDQAGLNTNSWVAWRTLLRSVFALKVPSGDHLGRYRKHTARQEPPDEPVSECWVMAGRRGGKSRMAALIALYKGVTFDPALLAPGEVGVIPVLAADRRQAGVVLKYLKALCELPEVRPFVARSTRESVELRTNVHIEIHTSSFRTIRGYTCVASVLDEVAFWRDESTSVNPDSEILAALRPSMATVPGSLLFAISSPYARRGELYATYGRYWGVDNKHGVLVWNSDSVSLNPTLPARIIERAFEADPIAAASEYGSGGLTQFRRDVELYVDPEAVNAVTVDQRRELPYVEATRYYGFVDPSGGSQDSFTLAIAHREGDDRTVLDCVREVRPPFSPDAVVADFATILKSYSLSSATGDRYGGQWVAESFRGHGVSYTSSELSKSDIYRELVAPINSGRVELLDNATLRAQLCGLERRVARGGKDSIDHGPGAHDDLANAAAGALILALPRTPAKRGRYVVRWA